MRFLLDLLFPFVSLSGEVGKVVTAAEYEAMRSSPLLLCTAELRERGLRSLDCIAAATTYQASPQLRRAVHRLKYAGLRALHVSLGAMLVDASMRLDPVPAPILCPVPLHWIRTCTRGFNQSALLARTVAAARGWTADPRMLRRVRPTGHQTLRCREERFAAVADAFRPRRSLCDVPRVILVDDIATTGATLDACAAALKSAGVGIVEGLVLAQGTLSP